MASIAILTATPKGLSRVPLTDPWPPRSARSPYRHELQLHALDRLVECTCPPPVRGLPRNLCTALRHLRSHHLGQEQVHHGFH
ncbi:hypothetical protein [Methylobacterium nigriterrae]|uniref:hypothetical protein n=1 Tax=Methylobacterium nigriterrae TaxID=3127512 RepID=UPI003014127C